jgi:hypothetical protein
MSERPRDQGPDGPTQQELGRYTRFEEAVRKRREALVGSVRKSTFAGNVKDLRKGAIEPLPQRERTPVALRELEWVDKPDGTIDPGAIVRKLYGRASTSDEHNELGCAYALLAWTLPFDRYWIDAIAELHEACDRADADSREWERADDNLARVGKVSPFPTDR